MESGMELGVVLVLCTTCWSISLVKCNLPSMCSSLSPLRPQRFTRMGLSMSGEELLEGRHWKILKAMGIPDHLTCLLRNLYAFQEAIVRIRHGTMDWFKIGKGVRQSHILSPCLFNLYADCVMQNTRLDEAQAGIKISWRNISNLRYADDTTLISESEEELKNFLLKVEKKKE